MLMMNDYNKYKIHVYLYYYSHLLWVVIIVSSLLFLRLLLLLNLAPSILQVCQEDIQAGIFEVNYTRRVVCKEGKIDKAYVKSTIFIGIGYSINNFPFEMNHHTTDAFRYVYSLMELFFLHNTAHISICMFVDRP